MIKKRALIVVLFAAFIAVMTAAAFAAEYLPITTEWVFFAVGGGVFLFASLLGALLFSRPAGALLSLLLAAGGLGLVGGGIFSYTQRPELGNAATVCVVALGWIFLFALLSNLSLFKENGIFLLLWGAAAIGGAVAFALYTSSGEGWYSLLMLVPALVFIFGFAMDVQSAGEHLGMLAAAFSIIVLVVFIIAMHFINSAGGPPEFPVSLSDNDDPYSYEE